MVQLKVQNVAWCAKLRGLTKHPLGFEEVQYRIEIIIINWYQDITNHILCERFFNLNFQFHKNVQATFHGSLPWTMIKTFFICFYTFAVTVLTLNSGKLFSTVTHARAIDYFISHLTRISTPANLTSSHSIFSEAVFTPHHAHHRTTTCT